MSTKTSIKRIALVAVSALGFGLLSTAPSSAAFGTGDYIKLGTATIDNAVTTLAARIGQQVSITITGDVAANATSTSQEPALSVAAAITSQPASSAVYPTLTGSASASIGATNPYNTTNAGLTYADADGSGAGLVSTGTASTVATLNYATAGANLDVDAADDQTLGTLTFTPTHAGTYSITVWNEADRCNATSNCADSSGTATAPTQASLSGSESFRVFTINVSSGVSKITLSPLNASSIASGLNGSLIKVSLADAAGNAAILAPGETVTLTPSGTGDIARVNGTAVTSDAGAAYNLASSDFNSSGVAWVNLTDATKGTTNLTAAINGANTTSTSITYSTAASQPTAAPTARNTTGWVTNSGDDIYMPIGTTTLSWGVAASTGSTMGISVSERLIGGVGAITGYTTALSYDQAASGSTTLGYAAISVTATTTATGQTAYQVAADAFDIALTDNDPSGGTSIDGGVEADAASLTNRAGTFTVSPAIVNAVAGSTNTLAGTLVDVFGRAYQYITISATVSGKNPVTTARTAVTDANGAVSFAFTDANTTTAVSDIVTFSVASGSTTTATITYGTNAVGKVALETPGSLDVVAGTTTTDIVASATGATGASATVTATITGSAGALLAGVPVTFSVAGLTGAEVHTTKVTVYTDTTGTASTSISSYAAGKATVTATAGGVSSTADIYFKQQTATEARTIAASVSGNVVTATVKDRYGNVVEGVAVNATRSGTGYFGSGASTSSGTTDKNGVVEFIFTGTGTVTVAFSTTTYGQSADAAGYVGTTAVTAYTAGTTTANQKGLGGSLSPAGVNSASVAVASVDAAAAAADAAADAAAEAIDAANAATDAANLAAEAADAATVAAEEARDAADAATAAVEELATQVATLMAALKAQITTLANTVAKIAKKVKA